MIITGTRTDFDDNDRNANLEAIWCDIETQRFYSELPELQVYLPSSYIQKTQRSSPIEVVTEEVLDKEIPVEELEDDGNLFLKLKIVSWKVH